MPYTEIIGYFSLAVTALIYLIYIPSIIWGTTRPHIFSFLIWATLTAVVFWIQYTSGSGAGSWSTGATAAVCFVIVALCLKYGTRDITRSDTVMFVLGVLSGVAWYVTSDPLYTLCLIIAAETFAFLPTFRKSYVRPYEEPVSAYALSGLKMLLSIGATEEYNFYTLAYPMVHVFLYMAFCIMVVIQRRRMPRPATAIGMSPDEHAL